MTCTLPSTLSLQTRRLQHWSWSIEKALNIGSAHVMNMQIMLISHMDCIQGKYQLLLPLQSSHGILQKS